MSAAIRTPDHRAGIHAGRLVSITVTEQPMFVIENNHTPIIDQAIFDTVQDELAKRRRLGRAVTPNETVEYATVHHDDSAA